MNYTGQVAGGVLELGCDVVDLEPLVKSRKVAYLTYIVPAVECPEPSI